MYEISYYHASFTCENGAIAKVIIPENATEDDVKGLCEFLEVIAKRKFKVEVAVLKHKNVKED